MTKDPPARTLHFDTLDEVLAEAMKIAKCPDAPTQGKWSAAENVWHVARYIQASVEGYPFSVPWYFKLLGPLMKNRMVNRPMASGFNTDQSVKKHMEPGGADVGEITMPRAIQLIEQWIGKAKAQGFIAANPVFGKMTTDQWVGLHCRHAELHLGMIELPDAP